MLQIDIQFWFVLFFCWIFKSWWKFLTFQCLGEWGSDAYLVLEIFEYMNLTQGMQFVKNYPAVELQIFVVLFLLFLKAAKENVSSV